MIFGTAWNWLAAQETWSTSILAVGAVLTVLFFGGTSWAITTFGAFLLFGNDPEYRRYRQSGGDPFFDNLPGPLKRRFK